MILTFFALFTCLGVERQLLDDPLTIGQENDVNRVFMLGRDGLRGNVREARKSFLKRKIKERNENICNCKQGFPDSFLNGIIFCCIECRQIDR